MNPDDNPLGCFLAVIVAIVLCVGAGLLMSGCGSLNRDEVGFKVGGSLSANKNKINGDLMGPGGRVWKGVSNGIDKYPSSKTPRFQDFDLAVTTKDSRRVTVKGQIRFNFVGESDKALTKKFAQEIGARRFGGERPGQSDDGWENFLNTLMDPEVNGSWKAVLGNSYCADLEPECRAIDPRSTVPPTNEQGIRDDVAKMLNTRLTKSLGEPYLRNIQVIVKDVDLSKKDRETVARVTDSQGATQSAEQDIETAKAEAKAITERAKALRKDPAQIALEVAKQCRSKDSCTLILDTTGKGVGASVPTK